jgi:hypothetical protein
VRLRTSHLVSRNSPDFTPLKFTRQDKTTFTRGRQVIKSSSLRYLHYTRAIAGYTTMHSILDSLDAPHSSLVSIRQPKSLQPRISRSRSHHHQLQLDITISTTQGCTVLWYRLFQDTIFRICRLHLIASSRSIGSTSMISASLRAYIRQSPTQSGEFLRGAREDYASHNTIRVITLSVGGQIVWDRLSPTLPKSVPASLSAEMLTKPRRQSSVSHQTKR